MRTLTIDEPIDIEGAALPHLDFSGTTFNALLSLRNAAFQGLAWFTDCTFNAAVNLSAVTFLTDARFEKARFGRGATFSGAEFMALHRSIRPSSTTPPISII